MFRLPNRNTSGSLALIAWVVAFVFTLAPLIEMPQTSMDRVMFSIMRLLVFLLVPAFWHWLTLYMRGNWEYGVFPNGNRSNQADWAVNYLGVNLWFMDVLTFELFLIPMTYLTILGIIFASSADFNPVLTILLTVIIWLVFFVYEGVHNNGTLFQAFRLSDLTWSTAIGLILDIVGIVLSVIQLVKS